MSKIFSFVELETNTGIEDKGYVSGIPDREDIQQSALYQELLEDCGGSQYISVVVSSYMYGEGEGENADDEDLAFIRSQEDFVEQYDVDLIGKDDFVIKIFDGPVMDW